jgi:large subunit ribosomal protein L6
MSRVGKKPVELVAGVQATIEARRFTVKGAKGELGMALPGGISVKQEGQQLLVECAPGIKNGGAMHGVTRTLIANMVKGVTEGYERSLQIVGVGYKAKVEGQSLVVQLGFSHPIDYPIPSGIKIAVGKDNTLVITGCDKQLVGKVSAEIRGFYPPEPYKGKGIRYKDERVKRKAGKAVATGSGS